MHVEVGEPLARQRARGSVVVGMDVRDDQAPEPSRSQVVQRAVDGVERLLRVHAAVEEVGLVPVKEEEDVDQAVLERDGQTKLEDACRNLGQGQIDGHPGIVACGSKMSSEPYSNVLKTSTLFGRSRCPKSR